MSNGPHFRTDLYRGTARFYDEFRPPYPQPLLDELCVRARITGTGRLLDLACGTGQIAFGLAPRFAEIWAVDQEPEAVEFGRAKARRRGVDNIRWIAGRAEDVTADNFELVAIGNAFHRLPRRAIAESALRGLVPEGHLALLWGDAPWSGNLEWQQVLDDTIRDWTRRAATSERVPADLEQHLADEPNATVLADAGFTIVGDVEATTSYEWTIETLTGFMYSTSILSQPALGPNVDAFARDLHARLLEVVPGGIFRQEISFACTLARKSVAGGDS